MSQVDEITEKGKKGIVGLLNQLLQVEYILIFNYPRIVDQLVNIDQVSEESVSDLERLGKESVRHSGLVAQLIVQLGGEAQWAIEPIDRMTDVGSILAIQLEKEKVAKFLYQQAGHMVQENQAKAKGFLSRLTIWRGEESRDFLSRSDVISLLNRLMYDEMGHKKVVERIIFELKTEPKKRVKNEPVIDP